MTRPEIIWEGYLHLWSNDDDTNIIIKKAPPGQEEKKLELYKVYNHSYQAFEEIVDEDTDFKELWRDDVANEYTEKWYDDWYDDNYSDIISWRCCEYTPDWKMTSNDLYRWCRNNRDEVYYWGQLEVEVEETISSYSELMSVLWDNWIPYETCYDEVLTEINLYFNDTTYRYVP